MATAARQHGSGVLAKVVRDQGSLRTWLGHGYGAEALMVLQGDVMKLAVGWWCLAEATTTEACSCCDGVLPIGCTR